MLSFIIEATSDVPQGDHSFPILFADDLKLFLRINLHSYTHILQNINSFVSSANIHKLELIFSSFTQFFFPDPRRNFIYLFLLYKC